MTLVLEMSDFQTRKQKSYTLKIKDLEDFSNHINIYGRQIFNAIKHPNIKRI